MKKHRGWAWLARAPGLLIGVLHKICCTDRFGARPESKTTARWHMTCFLVPYLFMHPRDYVQPWGVNKLYKRANHTCTFVGSCLNLQMRTLAPSATGFVLQVGWWHHLFNQFVGSCRLKSMLPLFEQGAPSTSGAKPPFDPFDISHQQTNKQNQHKKHGHRNVCKIAVGAKQPTGAAIPQWCCPGLSGVFLRRVSSAAPYLHPRAEFHTRPFGISNREHPPKLARKPRRRATSFYFQIGSKSKPFLKPGTRTQSGKRVATSGLPSFRPLIFWFPPRIKRADLMVSPQP